MCQLEVLQLKFFSGDKVAGIVQSNQKKDTNKTKLMFFFKNLCRPYFNSFQTNLKGFFKKK